MCPFVGDVELHHVVLSTRERSKHESHEPSVRSGAKASTPLRTATG
jgi:hypothetical protein